MALQPRGEDSTYTLDWVNTVRREKSFMGIGSQVLWGQSLQHLNSLLLATRWFMYF